MRYKNMRTTLYIALAKALYLGDECTDVILIVTTAYQLIIWAYLYS